MRKIRSLKNNSRWKKDISASIYLNFTDSGREDEEKITAGIGFHLGMFSLDYAIGLTKNLSLPHHISLSMKM